MPATAAGETPAPCPPTDPRELVLSLRDGWGARERDADRAGARRVPAETLAELRSSGILAAPVPVSLGGGGADLSAVADAVRCAAQRAPSTALCLAMPLGNAGNTRVRDDAVAPELRFALARGRQWIARRATQGFILAVANSEPGGGGDLAQTKTRAVCGADGVVRLTGRKSFATLGPDADYYLCAARAEDGRVDAYFVARDAPGLVVDDAWDPLGMRSTASVGLSLEDTPASTVFVYPGAITGASARHWSTLLFASVFVGLGEGAIEAAVRSAPAGSAWARSTIAESALALDAAWGLVQACAAADAIPAGVALVERARRAKTFAAKTALEAATRAAMIAGGRAYHPDHPIARFLLDAAAGPLLRPPVPQAMDAIAASLFEA